MYKCFFKRIIDILIAIGGLIVFSPVLLILILYIYLKTNQNPFFLQQRPGLKEKIFTVIKLRTMADKYDSEGNLLPNKERISRWGNFLRETSLDELPQLINILKGEMSLIGPRPLLPQYLPLYSELHRQRHLVRPGITGWAQVNGRNTISWQQKFDLDVYYVNNLSFRFDMKIFFMTLKKVLKKQDINSSKTVTMPEFDGTN